MSTIGLADVTCRRCGQPTDDRYCEDCNGAAAPARSLLSWLPGKGSLLARIRSLGSNPADGDGRGRVEPVSLDRDAFYEAVGVERRRLALRVLDDVGEPMELGDVANIIAAIENDVPLGRVTNQQYKRVYVGLQQAHCSKLAEWGLVEVDDDGAGTWVEATATGRAVRHLDADVGTQLTGERDDREDPAAELIKRAGPSGGGA